jgi:excisionase family DNA binding protein
MGDEQERLTYSVDEAASALGVNPRTVYEAIARGELPHTRVGRRIVIGRKALDDFLASGGSV